MSVEVHQRPPRTAMPRADDVDSGMTAGVLGPADRRVVLDLEAEPRQRVADEACAFFVELPGRVDSRDLHEPRRELDGLVGERVDLCDDPIDHRTHLTLNS